MDPEPDPNPDSHAWYYDSFDDIPTVYGISDTWHNSA